MQTVYYWELLICIFFPHLWCIFVSWFFLNKSVRNRQFRPTFEGCRVIKPHDYNCRAASKIMPLQDLMIFMVNEFIPFSDVMSFKVKSVKWLSIVSVLVFVYICKNFLFASIYVRIELKEAFTSLNYNFLSA